MAANPTDGRTETPEGIREQWKKRIEQARDARRPHEPIWLSNLAFAAGQHWLAWDERSRTMRHLAELDPRYAERELYTADRINEHVQAQLGELSTGDDRPELLLAQEGDTAEDLQREVNEAAAHGWDNEWGADSALVQARRLCLKLGVSAIRVRFDPTKGPLRSHVPMHPDTGQPVTDQAAIGHLEAFGQLPDGRLPVYKPVREGRTIWEPLSAFHLLTPPGVTHEDAFPWEGVMKPVLIDDLVEEFGDVAAGLEEDTDIGSLLGVSTSQQTRTGSRDGMKGRLRDHVWLFTMFERPCRKYPNGRVVYLASNQYRLLRVDAQAPYETCTSEYRAGIHYLHWWRRDDSFWSRAFIEPLKDPQRLINRRETQNAEIIDRGMPKVFTKEGTLVHNPAGLPLENIELKPDATEPSFFAGMGPGPWMYEDLAHHADNMAHASTLSPLRLGENPQNVDTYAQLALLNENEQSKRDVLIGEHNAAIAAALEDSMYDVRRYWPEQKLILVGGDEDAFSRKTFLKSRIPDFYVVRPAKGSAKPRTQGAELTRVDAIWNVAISSGLATGPNAQKWVDWYAKSTEAGQALDLPAEETDSQLDMAKFENFLMLDQGEDVQPAEYDLFPVHLPEHREAQNQARAAGDLEAFARIQRHIDAHQALEVAKAAKVAQAAQVTSPLGAAAPPQQAMTPGGTPEFAPHLLPPAPAPGAP